jgi:hypothetical protein
VAVLLTVGRGVLNLIIRAVLALLGRHHGADLAVLASLGWHLKAVIASWFREAGIAELSSLGCADSNQCVAMLRIMGRCALNLITGDILVVLSSRG